MLPLLLLVALPLDAATPTAAAAASSVHLEAVESADGAGRAQIVNGTARAIRFELRTCSSFGAVAGGKEQTIMLGACDDEPIDLVDVAPGQRLTVFLLFLPPHATALRYRSKPPVSRGAWSGDLSAPIRPWPPDLALTVRRGGVGEVLVEHRNASGAPLLVLTDRCGAPIFDQLTADGKPLPLAVAACDKTIEHERVLAPGESFVSSLHPGLLPGEHALGARYKVVPLGGHSVGAATPFRGEVVSPTVRWSAPW
jgi:hypothetical protein